LGPEPASARSGVPGATIVPGSTFLRPTTAAEGARTSVCASARSAWRSGAPGPSAPPRALGRRPRGARTGLGRVARGARLVEALPAGRVALEEGRDAGELTLGAPELDLGGAAL